MKVRPAGADAYVRSPPQGVRAILLYGPDSGLVRERAETAARAVAGDLSDPFTVVEFTAAALRDDPTKLADEAAAMSLTGGRRVVRLRDAGDGVAQAAADALSMKGDSLVIVESGDLPARSKLRALFEAAEDAAAIGCYLDDGKGLDGLVRDGLAAAGLSADRDTVSWIAANLGSDRMVSRMEIEKLVLYATGKSAVTLEDAQAVIGDSAAVTLDDVVHAAAGGNLEALTMALARARFEGVTAVSILRAAGRHISRLEEAVAAVAGGMSADQAVKSLRPPVFYKQQAPLAAQARRWRPHTLGRARAELIQAEIDCKSTGMPDEAVCERALMRIAAMAGARVPR
ncbi:MAG: DNA polymerase III subunit delta [Rhodospirillaceae bacterium]